MLGELLDFIIEGVLYNINLVYFLAMLLVPEIIKVFTYYNPRKRIRWFKLDKKIRFPFKVKKLIFPLGLIIGVVFWYFNILLPEDSKSAIIQLVFTYIIVTTMYDLLFHAIIKKFKEVLKTVGEAKVKPMEINLVDDFESSLDEYWYGDSSIDSSEYLTDNDVTRAMDNKKKEINKHDNPIEDINFDDIEDEIIEEFDNKKDSSTKKRRGFY